MTTDLRSRREALGFTRQQVAHEAQCSLSMLQMLEAGYRPASQSAVLGRVEGVLGLHEQDGATKAAVADDSSSATGAAA